MTTNDERTQPVERPIDQRDYAAQPSAERLAYPSSEQMVQPDMTVEPTDAHKEPTNRDLFADDELAGLRARWDNVQAGFVDDPKECVQRADSLVSDVVEQLTAGFTHARSQLEEQWARGEQASTEDLRIALKRYREFFDRLLAV